MQAFERRWRSPPWLAQYRTIRPGSVDHHHVSRRIDASLLAPSRSALTVCAKDVAEGSTMLNEQDGEEPVCLRPSALPTHRRDACYAPQSLTQVPHAQSTTEACHSQLPSA
jgi:hypothetical protein